MSDLTIPGRINVAQAHGDLSHTAFALLVAVLRSGELRMGNDGCRDVHASQLAKLPGAPSQRWLDQHLDELIARGFIGVTERRLSGRERRSFFVCLGRSSDETLPHDRAVAESGGTPLARGGQAITTSTANDNSTISSNPNITGDASTTTSGAPTELSQPPPDLEERLLRILAIEGVTDPEEVIREHSLNSVAYAVKKLFEKLQRGEEFTHGRPNYIAGVLRDRSRRPQVLNWAFLGNWEEVSQQASNVSRFRQSRRAEEWGLSS